MNDGRPLPGDGSRTPPRDLDVPPTRVSGARGGGRVALAALAGIIVAITAAVGVAQLGPSVPPPAPPVAGTPAAASATAAGTPAAPGTPVPDASAILAGTTPRLSRERLGLAVRDGSLEGRLVFVDGVLRATPTPCADLDQATLDCVDLEIPGLGLPVSPGDGALPWPGDPPPGAWLVTVARDGGLVYLGSLVPWTGRPRTLSSVSALLAQRGGVPPHGTLFEVDGYLVTNPVHACFRPGVAATPCPPPPPFLAEHEPLADGMLVSDFGETVAVVGLVPGVDPGAIVTPGTFLVEFADSGGDPWRIVARYEPAVSVRVLAP